MLRTYFHTGDSRSHPHRNFGFRNNNACYLDRNHRDQHAEPCCGRKRIEQSAETAGFESFSSANGKRCSGLNETSNSLRWGMKCHLKDGCGEVEILPTDRSVRIDEADRIYRSVRHVTQHSFPSAVFLQPLYVSAHTR